MSELSYKICAELKDVGFPQTKEKGEMNRVYLHIPKKDNLIKDDGTVTDREAYWKFLYNKNPQGAFLNEWVRCPTLEELIYACNPEKTGLRIGYGGVWRAAVETGFKNGKFIQVNADGKTPSEAMAKLYLKLNEK